ncbi:hypothetical protein SARC_00556 [Sphaeroforma arctica JP610]|uniref:Tyrosinase copper-binding domain-containing protein n=1 Tax=Sphaeroforma arctica JP610 TaxID=667725 RepID=A0A0L0GEJ5_9EUKA|nr:hypothetical protein SARC_00556 [Sphaeroforma arctica JP610]KNC87314.1 hypothetical protein SARC_00556 [Sphaeroforma arctica JP610]|eukprot:XP_014161216.1 hypothetical protein SARC_00556 [Sphaeroforma arctica JP610]
MKVFSLMNVLVCSFCLVSALSSPRQASEPGRRVRREIRDLTESERLALFEAMWEMRNLSTKEGQEKYGSAFRTWDYLVAKHAVAAEDPSGDQGHYGPCFITYHRALMLETENILLSINPEFKALPYWDLTLDAGHGGRYREGDDEYIFSDTYLGSYTGNEEMDYAVTDGAFAYWPVTKFDKKEYGLLQHIYSGSSTTGYNRRGSNELDSPYLTRFPKGTLSYTNYEMDETIEGTKEDNDICSSFDYVADIEHFVNCVDAEDVSNEVDGPPAGFYYKDGEKKTVRFIHSQAHLKIGSRSTLGVNGDFRDAATSINDPFFLFHHTNIDRLFMQWQMSALNADSDQDASDVMYGFPTHPPSKQETDLGFTVYDVCWEIDNTISPNFPFYENDLFGEGNDAHSTSGKGKTYTNRDILRFTGPGNSIYTYDTTMW